jgi:hypothetical protein
MFGRSLAASAVMALLLAGSTAALAQNASRPMRVAVRPHPAFARQHDAGASVFAAPPRVPHSVLEREGLTRNPDACAVWGCIGNN